MESVFVKSKWGVDADNVRLLTFLYWHSGAVLRSDTNQARYQFTIGQGTRGMDPAMATAMQQQLARRWRRILLALGNNAQPECGPDDVIVQEYPPFSLHHHSGRKCSTVLVHNMGSEWEAAVHAVGLEYLISRSTEVAILNCSTDTDGCIAVIDLPATDALAALKERPSEWWISGARGPQRDTA